MLRSLNYHCNCLCTPWIRGLVGQRACMDSVHKLISGDILSLPHRPSWRARANLCLYLIIESSILVTVSNTQICVCVCMYACCVYVCMYVCMYVCIYVCMYVCMYVCINTLYFWNVFQIIYSLQYFHILPTAQQHYNLTIQYTAHAQYNTGTKQNS